MAPLSRRHRVLTPEGHNVSVLFPYQVGPLLVAMGLAGESTRSLLKVTLALFAVSLLALIPPDFLWWRLLRVI